MITTNGNNWKEYGQKTKIKQPRWTVTKHRSGDVNVLAQGDIIVHVGSNKDVGNIKVLPRNWWIVCTG